MLARLLLACVLLPLVARADDAPKPVVAIFPLAGDATDAARERAGAALRAKLDRTGKFEVLDGFKMKDVAAESKTPVAFDTPADAVKALAATEKPAILLWGDLVGTELRVNVLDLRQPDGKPRPITKTVAEPQDMRFATEQVLETINDVGKFAHPIDVAVFHDAKSDALWKSNPNLAPNGDFSDQGAWHGILESQYYPIKFLGGAQPDVDKVGIVKTTGPDGKPTTALAMRMSRTVAETSGLACLSAQIKIEPDTRYRLAFKYQSDGPTVRPFVKGYTTGKGIDGKPALREVYKRQVPPVGATKGKWAEVVDDLNPQHVAFPVEYLKVDLYIYLTEGTVLFDDVVLKAVGEQTRKAQDKAIKPPGERPAGAKD